MNIHIQKEEYEKILQNDHTKLIMGSPLYYLQDENSDNDVLVLHDPFINQVINPFINHHHNGEGVGVGGDGGGKTLHLLFSLYRSTF